MIIEEAIHNLLCSNVKSIQNPDNPADVYLFKHHEELVETLIQFLKFPCNEPSIERIGNKILSALAIFAALSIETNKLSSALEELGTGFESYLKKIAVLRYDGDTITLRGDGRQYKGLLHSTLGSLLEGKVAKIKPGDNSIPTKKAPIVTFSYNGNDIRDVIYSKARDLRNDIHEAEQRTYSDLFQLFQITVAAYLFALEENLCLIRQKVDPLFSYLLQIEKDFQNWEHKYVELIGEERKPLLEYWPDLQAFEWKNEISESSDETLPWDKLIENFEIDLKRTAFSSQTSVITLANTKHRFWLIGEPGAGKTTTLQRVAWLRAKELLSLCYLSKPLPVFIKANQYDQSHPFRKIISEYLKVNQQEVDYLLNKGKLWILIDGWNEITTSEQDHAIRDLQHILNEYHNLDVIITTRKYGYKHRFDIPIYELLPLSEKLILEYLEMNLPTPERGEKIFGQLKGAKNLLLEFASNPLMLQIVTNISKNGNLPANRGQLFKYFMKWFLNLEEKKTKQINPYLKEDVLIDIAFITRKSGKTYLPQAMVIDCIRKTISSSFATIDSSSLFQELLNNGILEVDMKERVTFFHELVLEYFAALKLLKIFYQEKNKIRQYCKKNFWSESILMAAGLLDQANEFVSIVLQEDIVLASRCVASGAQVKQTVISNIIKASENLLLEQNDSIGIITAITALLELASEDSLSLVLRGLHRDEMRLLTKALYQCERPEISALKLLTIKQITKEQIYYCLKLFESRLVNPTFFDNPQLANAELGLLTGHLENRYLTLIDTIGFPASIKQNVIDIVINLLKTEALKSAIWKSSITFSAHQNIEELVADIVEERIRRADFTDDSVYYPIFVACRVLGSFSRFHELAWLSTSQCLQLKKYSMAAKYIQQFSLQDNLLKQDTHGSLIFKGVLKNPRKG